MTLFSESFYSYKSVGRGYYLQKLTHMIVFLRITVCTVCHLIAVINLDTLGDSLSVLHLDQSFNLI